ncbi:peptide chain release factor 1 [Brachybacterium endophyticum]|uniref:Peptide chain release factor 1 n=1 Tax=Brachybacterium endophyticum TaxID=2182385 RepID=A0A2U2RHP3_9MICO|nr:peptide chain release factor 1 [Brachybacterium endophyticum]PWH05389.1 peptide chain release factor 1 [Brachybacterium endophyticum]
MAHPADELEGLPQERLRALEAEHADLEERMAAPDLHADAARARRVGRRYAEVDQIITSLRALRGAREDAAAARELAAEDPDFASEADRLESEAAGHADHLRELLAPRDEDDSRDVILEIKAGAGGEESALFAAEMLRMYRQYALTKGWSVEVIDSTDSDLGGLRDATVSVRAARSGAPADGVWAHLKYEGGVHRVQRVPVTESAGRIHTSAVGVLVMPEADETDEAELLSEQMAPANLRIDVFRSSGPGGQSVNTTDSAVRITHLPTGIVVSCQNEKSQLQNREQALRILRSRLLDARRAEQDAEAAASRRSQVRTVDRSERIRTYNFPESRVTDHRTGFKAGNLEQVLGGDLDALIDSSRRAEAEERLRSAAEAEL